MKDVLRWMKSEIYVTVIIIFRVPRDPSQLICTTLKQYLDRLGFKVYQSITSLYAFFKFIVLPVGFKETIVSITDPQY